MIARYYLPVKFFLTFQVIYTRKEKTSRGVHSFPVNRPRRRLISSSVESAIWRGTPRNALDWPGREEPCGLRNTVARLEVPVHSSSNRSDTCSSTRYIYLVEEPSVWRRYDALRRLAGHHHRSLFLPREYCSVKVPTEQSGPSGRRLNSLFECIPDPCRPRAEYPPRPG